MSKKLLQNRIAESGLTLPVAAVYAAGVWLLNGALTNGWWAQLICMALAVYVLVEVNNSNALIRVRSRMVGSMFLLLSCMDSGLFASAQGGLTCLFVAIAFWLLFQTYQQPDTPGRIYYGFLCIGIASLTYVQILFFVPLTWLLVHTQLQSMSWRSWIASILGLITPYWLSLLWAFHLQDGSFYWHHFHSLTQFVLPYDYSLLKFGQLIVFIFTLSLLLMGIVHFVNKSYEDRIRIRQLYGFFGFWALGCTVFLALQPQHYDVLMRILFLCVSPFAAHLFTLTHSRVTNVLFIITIVLTILIAFYNLLITDFTALSSGLQLLWNGLLSF